MSSRPAAAAVAVAVLLGVGALSAQAAPAPDTSFAAAVRVWRQRVTTEAVRDSTRSRRAEERIISVGDFRLRVLPEVMADVQAAATEAWADLSGRYAGYTTPLAQVPIRVTSDGNDAWQLAVSLPGGTGVSRGGIPGRKALAIALRSFAERLLWDATDPALRAWLPDQVLDTGDSARVARTSYYLLALGGAVPAKACVLGDLGACEEALGLVAGDDPVTRWYDAAGRRALILATAWDWGPVQMDWLACTKDQSDEACLRVFGRAMSLADRTPAEARTWGNNQFRVPIPLGNEARMVYLGLALDAGGAGAWGRLLAEPSRPLSERFTAASGVPADVLLQRWRDRVEQGRPAPVVVGASLLLTAVLWAVLLLLVTCWGRR